MPTADMPTTDMPTTVRTVTLLALACALLVSTVALVPAVADASTPVPGRQVWDSDTGPQPTEVVRSLVCKIKFVLPERTLVVTDEWGDHKIQIADSVPLRAEERDMFDGRRKLDFEDLEPGHHIKLKFLTETGEIVRVRVLEEAPGD